MARSLSQTLTKLTLTSNSRAQPPPRLLSLRAQSNQSDCKIDLDIDSTSSTTSDPDLLAFRKIEDAIHRILVRRSAPDWLPFIPGSSYWVPPRSRTQGIADLVGKLAITLTQDEAMSLTTHRGWPSSSYFVKGASSHTVEVETTLNKTQSEDEEG